MAKKKQRPIPRKSNPIMVYAAVAVLIIALLAIYHYSGNSGNSSVTVNEKLPTTGKFVKLNKPGTYEEGKVKIMEFMKFDCSHCYDMHRSMPALLNKYGGNIQVSYIPIVWQGQSTKSIEAYIIAEQMGKGEEMRDALFQAKFVKGSDIMESSIAIEDAAASIGLGADFKAKLEGGEGRKAALSNLGMMSDFSIQGTPTLIINGNINVDPPTIANLEDVVGSLVNAQ
ncbi:MAG: thioredoxin domain-containing protein [Candidatus Methanoperedens sp.]|nr:thioredoxin domain-containing protein [Candidatus Methanoperedens sp.]MCE8425654.1 thioredoxin domain-containing protein [Candidatus Methanoperedens sp.]MCE8428483.1 thioredoxin domain-containing protein [Candidatus Methanoperedens sp.]